MPADMLNFGLSTILPTVSEVHVHAGKTFAVTDVKSLKITLFLYTMTKMS